MYARFWQRYREAMMIDWVALSVTTLLIGIMAFYATFNAGAGSIAGSVNRALIDAGSIIATGTATNTGIAIEVQTATEPDRDARFAEHAMAQPATETAVQRKPRRKKGRGKKK